ncbi:MAG TPA: UDP-3-O-(3-hydroxymyristoyl)glucosamine N-acyltransferase [Phenylobacterium sp.]|jgi:UDP-3-O-[3-hydroxymyristoyl] glucosamine N-acyltransferase
MPDPRFFEDLGPVTLAELAEVTGSVLADSSTSTRQIRAVSILEGAAADTVTFAGKGFLESVGVTHAGACFLLQADAEKAPAGCAVLLTPSPQRAYALAAQRLHRPRIVFGQEAIAPTAKLEPGVVLAHGVVVGAGAQIGRGTRIGANSVIGPGVSIGRDGDIAANVTIGFALIGDRVRILAGAVIGEPGFGATVGDSGLIDIPQLGRVILQDGVTVGANTCIDRGAFDDTTIGENTKIDNLVQIAHNVRVGRNCVMAAQTGISGSVDIGDGVQFGGRAGVADHLTIGAGARIAAAAGVMQDVPAGETWGGAPARRLREFLRETAWLMREARRKGERE